MGQEEAIIKIKTKFYYFFNAFIQDSNNPNYINNLLSHCFIGWYIVLLNIYYIALYSLKEFISFYYPSLVNITKILKVK